METVAERVESLLSNRITPSYIGDKKHAPKTDAEVKAIMTKFCAINSGAPAGSLVDPFVLDMVYTEGAAMVLYPSIWSMLSGPGVLHKIYPHMSEGAYGYLPWAILTQADVFFKVDGAWSFRLHAQFQTLRGQCSTLSYYSAGSPQYHDLMLRYASLHCYTKALLTIRPSEVQAGHKPEGFDELQKWNNRRTGHEIILGTVAVPHYKNLGISKELATAGAWDS